MWQSRIVQLAAGGVMVGAFVTSGALVPSIIEEAEENTLRYTDVGIDNAPPEVVLGDAIGALRGILVDVLWVRATMMKERGLYYEANTLADMITKLQPRFAPVWAMHGHNMAYNISVATHTEAERWEWVKKGIDLVRNRGLRYNPNDLVLYKELSFWLMHKIEGISDDANLYYKKQFAREWHEVLGEPPYDWDERIEWLKKVADAADTLEEVEERAPGARKLAELIEDAIDANPLLANYDFEHELLKQDQQWITFTQSWYAQELKAEDALRQTAEATDNPTADFFVKYDELKNDPKYAELWEPLLAYARKRTLIDGYNMNPDFMVELTETLGPIDWRHASAHALYWSRMGSKIAESRRKTDDDIYIIINNDRMTTSSMQDLARYGLIYFDPGSNDVPSRMADSRWIPGIDKFFESLYEKHQGVRGWGPDNFIAFHENFLSSSVRELYRRGDLKNAEAIYERLDSLYGTGHMQPNNKYVMPLENFVKNETYEEYAMQPHIATTDVQNSLYHGIRFGLGRGKKEIYEDAKNFAKEVLVYFKTNEYNDFVNKFGEARISGIISNLENVELSVWAAIMMDTSIPLKERLDLFNYHADAQTQLTLYGDIREPLYRQAQSNLVFRQMEFNELLPEPPGWEQYRIAREQFIKQQQAERDANRAKIDK